MQRIYDILRDRLCKYRCPALWRLEVSLSRMRTLRKASFQIITYGETYFYRGVDKNSHFIHECNVSFDERFANSAFTVRFSCERKNFQVQRAKESSISFLPFPCNQHCQQVESPPRRAAPHSPVPRSNWSDERFRLLAQLFRCRD